MATIIPDIPGARRWVMINYRILDSYGAREQEGTLKLYTSRWAHAEPFLMAELIEELGYTYQDFLNPAKARIHFTWAFLPVPHPLSTDEQEWIEWAKKNTNGEEK